MGTADDVASRGAARDALVCADFEAILWENQNTYAPRESRWAREAGHGLRECNFILAQIYKETMMRIIIMMMLIKTNIGEMNRSIVKGREGLYGEGGRA